MSTRSRRVRIWLVMIVAAFALAPGLAACGGSSPASPTPSATPSADRPQPSATARAHARPVEDGVPVAHPVPVAFERGPDSLALTVPAVPERQHAALLVLRRE